MVRDVWLPPGNPGCLEATEFRPAFATILALARFGALVVRRAAALSKRHAKNRARARVVEAERWPPVWPLQGARASARARRHARMYSRACVRRDGHLAVGVGSQVKTASTPCLWTRRTHRDHPCARAFRCVRARLGRRDARLKVCFARVRVRKEGGSPSRGGFTSSQRWRGARRDLPTLP